MRPRIVFAFILLFAWRGHFSAQADPNPPPEFLWWEAESATTHTFPERTWFSPGTDPGWKEISGGDWLTSTGPATLDPPAARYELNIPGEGEGEGEGAEAGGYQLWVRKFWRHGPMHYRFDDRPWRTLSRDIMLIDRTRLPKDAELDWVYLGDFALPAGPTTFEFQLALDPGQDTVSGLDCFVLTAEPFFPRGKLKPDEHPDTSQTPPGWFAIDPPLDTFADDALLDLRHLNETQAGINGPLRRSPDGNSIHLGDSTPVRFWGVNLSAQEVGQPDPIVSHTVRRLAKLGVNMVRYHSPLWLDNGLTYGSATGPLTLDPIKVERLHHLVAAAKQQGIYTNLSWYFPLWINDASRVGLAGYDDPAAEERRPFAALFFNDIMQAHYFAQMRLLLSQPNPNTGLPLARDPAVGIIELCNEDSLFFWTFTHKQVPPEQWEILERNFAAYLVEQYGSLDAAIKRWPSATHKHDDISGGGGGGGGGGRVGVFEAWHMTGEARDQMTGDQRRRIADQVAFLAGLQRGFYEKAAAFLHDDLGYRGLISASNWITADPGLTDAIERWTYTATDVIDQHGYFKPKHEGDAASYSVRVGQTFDSRAAVLKPTAPPLRTQQVVGHPHMISELGWTTPNHTRADATLLTAAAMSVQGIDAVNFFIWNATGDFDTTFNKFALATPVIAGAFPAMALMVRRGDLPEAPVAVHEALRTTDLFNLEGTAALIDFALDEFRAGDVPPGASVARDVPRFDKLAGLVGRVTRSFNQPDDTDVQTNLHNAINREAKQLTSLHSHFRWDWNRGVATINTARTQALAGYLSKAGRVTLGDVTIHCRNDFGQVAVTALDDLPLVESRRILIQAVTQEQLTGFTHTDGGEITSLGRLPWLMKSIDATVTLPPVPPVRRAIALDTNGQATGDAVQFEAGVVTLPPDRLYTVIER